MQLSSFCLDAGSLLSAMFGASGSLSYPLAMLSSLEKVSSP